MPSTINNKSKVSKVLWIVLIFNLLVASTKIILGMYVNSSVIFSDGLHSISDSLSNIVGLITIHYASKPADECHTYGHSKFETIASLGISAVLFFTAINIISSSLKLLFNPTTPNINTLNIAIMIFTLVVNLTVAIIEKHYGNKYKSSFLIADAKHTLSDVYVTTGVIITLILLLFGAPILLDPIISILVAIVIFRTGLTIFKDASNVLSDAAIIKNQDIENIIREFDFVKDVSLIRNRGNELTLFIEFTVLLDKDITVETAHQYVNMLENKISDTFDYKITYNIHTEPF